MVCQNCGGTSFTTTTKGALCKTCGAIYDNGLKTRKDEGD